MRANTPKSNPACYVSERALVSAPSTNFAGAPPATRSVSRTLRKHGFTGCTSYSFHLTGFFFRAHVPSAIRVCREGRAHGATKGPSSPRPAPGAPGAPRDRRPAAKNPPGGRLRGSEPARGRAPLFRPHWFLIV